MSWMVPRRGAPLVALALIWSMPALVTPGLATAEPDPNSVATLIADVAEANQRLQDLGAQIQTQQESVNKALVALQDARDNAATAQQEIDTSQSGLKDANAAIAAAQAHFDKYAEAAYINGPSASYLTATDPGEMINTAATGQALTISSQEAIADLQRTRTELANQPHKAPDQDCGAEAAALAQDVAG